MFSALSLKYKLLLPVFLLGIFSSVVLLVLLYFVRSEIPDSNIILLFRDELTRLITITIVVVVGVSTVFIVLAYLYSRDVVRNIQEIQRTLNAVAAGNLQEKVESMGSDEFGILAHKINEVITELIISNAALTQRTQEYGKALKQLGEKNDSLEEMRLQTETILNDLKHKTNTLQAENAKNAAVIANIGDGLIITDSQRRITLVNAAAEHILGYSAQELEGVIWPEEKCVVTDEFGHKVLPDSLPIVRALRLQETQKTTLANAYYYTRKNGTKFPVAITASPIIIDEEVTGVIIVFRDITNDKEVDKAKSEFVSLASHQLRTPLTSINWYTEMLLAGDAGQTNDKQLKYLSEIYRGSQRMVNLVNSLLNASRIELGTLKVLPEKINLRHVTDSVLNELAPMIDEKKLSIETEYKDIPEIDLDPNLIRVVFQNIISNAVIYTPDKGSIAVTIEPSTDHALVKVQDTGYGIPENQKDKIFTKLFRADNVQQMDTNGSGLGLYISRSIIEQMGGQIWFESEQNKGSAFYIKVPYTGMHEKLGTKGLE